MERVEGYEPLERVLNMAYEQAAKGKGTVRHGNGKPFLGQPIMAIGRMVGMGYNTGQACKKAVESSKLLDIRGKDPAIAELLGAINYLASAVLLIEEGINNEIRN